MLEWRCISLYAQDGLFKSQLEIMQVPHFRQEQLYIIKALYI